MQWVKVRAREPSGFVKNDPNVCRVPAARVAVEEKRRLSDGADRDRAQTRVVRLRWVGGYDGESVPTVRTKEAISRASTKLG